MTAFTRLASPASGIVAALSFAILVLVVALIVHEIDPGVCGRDVYADCGELR